MSEEYMSLTNAEYMESWLTLQALADTGDVLEFFRFYASYLERAHVISPGRLALLKTSQAVVAEIERLRADLDEAHQLLGNCPGLGHAAAKAFGAPDGDEEAASFDQWMERRSKLLDRQTEDNKHER